MVKCLQILCLVIAAAASARRRMTRPACSRPAKRPRRRGTACRPISCIRKRRSLEPGNALYARKQAALQGAPRLYPGRPCWRPWIPPSKPWRPSSKPKELWRAWSWPPTPPPVLAPAPGKQSFDLKETRAGPVREGRRGVWHSGGVRCRLRAAPRRRLRSASRMPPPPEALRALEAATDSFLVPLSAHSLMVARDTAQKRTELMPVMARGGADSRALVGARGAGDLDRRAADAGDPAHQSGRGEARGVFPRYRARRRWRRARCLRISRAGGRRSKSTSNLCRWAGRPTSAMACRCPVPIAIVDFGKSFQNMLPAALRR